ncbi:MAG: ACP S-malonyltransferase [Planctomycetota bacterium]|nr:ACP S-malonyltransferase [Planctomycetota bacterium]
MSESLVVLCPGQGAQAVGMGARWRESSPAAREVFDRADRVVGARFDRPLSELCAAGPEALLNRTDVAQPAIYTAGVACFRGLFGDAPPAISFAAGLSLGEYTALHLAGAFGFEEGLELVLLRGRAMQEAAEASPSGMVALIGADESQAMQVCERAAQGEVLCAANFNAPGQIVLSGTLAACDRAVQAAAELSLRATKLAVAGAFHSPLMAPAAERLAGALASAQVRLPGIPVVSNVTARPHENDAGSIRRLLVRQLTEPVLWSQSCGWLAGQGAASFHELAPGKVLAGLMRRIDRGVRVISHDEPE